MATHRSRLTLPFALITAILAVSTSSIFIRFAQEEAPSLVIAALRLTFATILLAPIALLRHRQELKSLTRNELLLGIFAGLFLAVHFASWISSLEYTTVASSVVFVSTGPLWVALLSPFFLNERIRQAAVAGLCIAILGGIIIGVSDACSWTNGLRCPQPAQVLQGRAMWGNFLALVGAWAVSGYIIIGRKVRSKISLIPYIFLVYGISAIALIVIMFVAGESPRGYPAQTYGWIFLLALFPQLIGHSTYNWALRYLPASFVAITTLAEPVGSAILAYFLLRETPTTGVLIGGLLILIGIYLAAQPRKIE
jgi:drug/metabolite transporter (DMT)-like permease